MIQITGKIFEITTTPFTDKSTGEVTVKNAVELLHKEKGKNIITSLGIDSTVVETWRKAIGKDTTNEVAFYSMSGTGGKTTTGLYFTDKKCLPVVRAAV